MSDLGPRPVLWQKRCCRVPPATAVGKHPAQPVPVKRRLDRRQTDRRHPSCPVAARMTVVEGADALGTCVHTPPCRAVAQRLVHRRHLNSGSLQGQSLKQVGNLARAGARPPPSSRTRPHRHGCHAVSRPRLRHCRSPRRRRAGSAEGGRPARSFPSGRVGNPQDRRPKTARSLPLIPALCARSPKAAGRTCRAQRSWKHKVENLTDTSSPITMPVIRKPLITQTTLTR
jgi:hypothetical protein